MEIKTASVAATRKAGDGRQKPQKAAAFIVSRIVRVSQMPPAKQVGKPSPWLLVCDKISWLNVSIQEVIKQKFLPLFVSRARQLARLHSNLHLSLGKRIGWYASYHKWPKKRIVDSLVLGVYAMSMFGIIAVNISKSFAGDTDTSWDFANPNHYVLDGGIEIGTNKARLSAQNYIDDPDTAALYHLDEPSGSIATDSSSYANDGNVSGGGFTAGNLNNAYALSGPLDGIKVTDSAQNSLGQNHTIEGWTKLDEALSPGSTEQRQALADKGDYMVYYDNESGKLTYEIANPNYGVWTEAGGNDVNGSWDQNGKRAVNTTVMMNGNLYAGLGIDNADAEVWRWNGSLWEMIGGDGINESWPDQTYEYVYTLETDGSNIYAGLGSTAGDAEVWACRSSSPIKSSAINQ